MNYIITCDCCGKEFVFSKGEQKFYLEKGFMPPKKCKNCRGKTKEELGHVRTSNFCENAQIYGMPASVEGGITIEYKYFIIVNRDSFVKILDNKIIIDKHKKSFFTNWEDVVKIRNILENKGFNIKIDSISNYASIRI